MTGFQRWSLLALQVGAGVGAIGMIAQQAVVGTLGNVIFTVVIAVLFVWAVFRIAAGQRSMLAASSEAERFPTREPLKMIVVAMLVIAIVMWLAGGYALFWTIRFGGAGLGWLSVALCGVALCSTGATVMLRDNRERWCQRYRR